MNPAVATGLDLRDIHAAPSPGFWPPAPGWWLLALLFTVLLLTLSIWLYRYHRNARQQRQILNQIDNITYCNNNKNDSEIVAEIAVLLRRIALRRYSRERVASLTGADWLRFLDETGGDGEFQHGVGKVLATGAYTPRMDALPAAQLLDLARRWARKNLSVTS